jgi:glycosyltransferase involved in cell wall biosynthesis
MKKKIAIIHNLPGGGALRMINAIIKKYKKNTEIDLITISDIDQPKIAGIKNIRIKVNPWKGFFKYNLWLYLKLPIIHKNISKKIDWNKYDFVFVTHDYFTKSPYIIKYINRRIIYLCQEPQREYYEPWSIHAPRIKDKIANIFRFPIKLIDEINVSFVDKILCNSNYSKKVLEKIYKKECEVIYPGVDRAIFKYKKSKKKKYILCVGGINRVKGQDFIIKSLESLLGEFKLILIGNGRKEDLEYLNEISNSNKNIKIINNLPDRGLARIYRESQVTCIAAYREPFGLSSLESQACGTTVVTIDDGGTKETIIDGVTGYITSRNETEYLTCVIKAIANGKNMKNDLIKNINNRWTWDITLSSLDKYFT